MDLKTKVMRLVFTKDENTDLESSTSRMGFHSNITTDAFSSFTIIDWSSFSYSPVRLLLLSLIVFSFTRGET